jgi:hypothetical protein
MTTCLEAARAAGVVVGVVLARLESVRGMMAAAEVRS